MSGEEREPGAGRGRREIEVGWRAVTRAGHEAARPVGVVRRFIDGLGPGLIAGAADDDPSGISTYSTAGAAFGFATLWTALFSFPLMAAVQLMCARIGMVSGRGLASVLRHFYSRPLLWFACVLVLLANTVNIAADLGGMADVTAMLTHTSPLPYVPAYVALILSVLLATRYRTIVRMFKWLTLVLFAYVAAAFLAHPPWHQVLRHTVLPHIEMSRAFLMAFVAIFGTTISPYLFFWQAAQTVDDERAQGRHTVARRMGATPAELRAARTDVVTGMLLSNAVMYFIILTTAATLHAAGQRDIQTAQQAAQALRPLAGNGASLLFALGIIGTGLLGVPVLAGSAAYAIAEAGGWHRGMGERPTRAGRFYLVLVVAMVAGMAMDYVRLDPIRMLYWSAVLNGVLAPPLIGIILFVCNDQRVMGKEVNGRWLNVFGGITLVVMSGAAILLLASLL